MAVLEERGYFWWNDERVKKGNFAAEGYVPGLLTIEDDGAIRLNLDGCLPSSNQRVPRFMSSNSGEAAARNIQGKLRGSNNYVLLLRAWDNGGHFNTGGISYESYAASRCLVSETQFRHGGDAELRFRSLTVDLKGYESWLWLNDIKVKRSNRGLTARYANSRDDIYRLAQGVLRIEYDLLGPYRGLSHLRKLELTQLANLHFTPVTAFALDDGERYYQQIEELFILLTDSNRNLDWPRVVSANGRQRSKLYFLRHKSKAEPPREHECLINFHKMRDDFGAVFSNWIDKRDQFGPAFYLYLGTRRGVRLYIEHRFVNLIWGLEAFDRRTGDDDVHPPLQAKIDRILESVPSGDRHWLKGVLDRAKEPNLSKRLFRTLRALALPLDETSLREFCDDCAKLRNAISHFGGDSHDKGEYNRFMRDLDKKSDALASMYHVLLLTEIGVRPELFNFETNNSFPAYSIASRLRAVGLIKKPDAPSA